MRSAMRHRGRPPPPTPSHAGPPGRVAHRDAGFAQLLDRDGVDVQPGLRRRRRAAAAAVAGSPPPTGTPPPSAFWQPGRLRQVLTAIAVRVRPLLAGAGAVHAGTASASVTGADEDLHDHRGSGQDSTAIRILVAPRARVIFARKSPREDPSGPAGEGHFRAHEPA
eukprot:SAG22_NODE_116_length_19306_cov_247.696517_22_plen_166_part_00